MIWILLAGFVAIVLCFVIFTAVFPSKKFMSDIYQEMTIREREQTKILRDMRNVFFAKNRKNKREGK